MDGLGMRGVDLQKFLMAARLFNVYILVRPTNRDSLKYIAKPGYYPKPMVCKAKTADDNPGQTRPIRYKGRTIERPYEVKGLVVHPGFHPGSYTKPGKREKALDCWKHTMEVLSPAALHYEIKPESWDVVWGRGQQGVHAPDWAWRVDVNPESPHFGCLQLKPPAGPLRSSPDWCYVHGDYDLKDVIVNSHEGRRRNAADVAKQDGLTNKTPRLQGAMNIPLLYGHNPFAFIQDWLNSQMKTEMVQHGAEAQFAWHGDEGIIVAKPNGTHQILYDAVTVQMWYRDLKRETLDSKPGERFDYIKDPKRIFNVDEKGVGHKAG